MGSPKMRAFLGKEAEQRNERAATTGAVRDMQLVTPSGGRTCGATSGLSLRASRGAQNRRALLLVAVGFDRFADFCSLHPPQAAVAKIAQRA